VDCHLRAVCCCEREAGAARRYGDEDRALQMQRLRARAAGADMTGGANGGQEIERLMDVVRMHMSSAKSHDRCGARRGLAPWQESQDELF
jgi:hypothetical protein